MIEIEHTGDGTLVHGTVRGDPAIPHLKAQGFKWSGRIDAWYLPRNQTLWTRTGKVNNLAQALEREGIEHTVSKDLQRETTAAERVEQKIERGEERRERFEDKAEQAQQRSDAHERAADSIASALNGQPILIGHYSESRTRKADEKIERDSRKSIEEWRKSQYYERRASATGAEARRLQNPRYLGEKLERLAAERRDVQRRLDGYTTPRDGLSHAPATGERRELLLSEADRLDDEIGFYTDTRDELGVKVYSRDTVAPGDKVRIRGRWYEVAKTHPKTVAVPSGYSWLDKVPYHEIERHEPKERETEPQRDIWEQAEPSVDIADEGGMDR